MNAPAPDNAFTLSNGSQITLPPHDEFYAQITVRNRGLIGDADQQRLRAATILVAGCGSVGGAAIEPLVRLGAEHLVLAEPDGYDLHNINRQSVRLQDVGRNKAEVFREAMRDKGELAAQADPAEQGAEQIFEAALQPIPIDISLFFAARNFGGDLFFFQDSRSPAVAESNSGVGNLTSYGIRNMVATARSLFVGMANASKREYFQLDEGDEARGPVKVQF